jgi:hypothetical protein
MPVQNRFQPRALVSLLCGVVFSVGGCSGSPSSLLDRAGKDRGIVYTEERAQCTDHNPLRNLYFGDLHSHASFSFDAWIWEAWLPPVHAYRFAKGEGIRLPPVDEDGLGTRTLRIDRPLDFAAVTEHSEFLGEVEACLSPDSGVYDIPLCRLFRQGTDASFMFFGLPLALPIPGRPRSICGGGGTDCEALAREMWKRIVEAAEAEYDRTSACTFTTFPAYEYTGSAGGSTLHSNVIFRNTIVPDLPVSYFEAATPWDLRAELKSGCMDSLPGCDVMAVPHNPNMSNGKAFIAEYPGEDGPEEQRRLAALRARMEPVAEIFQHKGSSECMNGLSGVPGDEDPLCGFENLHPAPITDCGDETGVLGGAGVGCISRWDFIRNVLLAGLIEEERLGVNPYKLGFIADTDTHNMSPGAVAEDRYAGHLGKLEDTPQKRLGPFGVTPIGIRTNPGGITGVWALENSRDAVFEALRRRETYGTSGPRIRVRFFGGWDLPGDMCEQEDFPETGYRTGVPMGGDLPPWPGGGAALRIFVCAERDPGTQGRAGTPLQRIQIIKGWLEGDGQAFAGRLKVFEVAGSRENGAGVDPESCESWGVDYERLCTVWTDPAFKPDERAYYYARVIENPTCRWSALECNRLSAEDRPASCSDGDPPRTIQERAWTSPVWYSPPE